RCRRGSRRRRLGTAWVLRRGWGQAGQARGHATWARLLRRADSGTRAGLVAGVEQGAEGLEDRDQRPQGVRRAGAEAGDHAVALLGAEAGDGREAAEDD